MLKILSGFAAIVWFIIWLLILLTWFSMILMWSYEYWEGANLRWIVYIIWSIVFIYWVNKWHQKMREKFNN